MAGLLLLGGHVQDQVTHTVAVAELVVVPAGGGKGNYAHIDIVMNTSIANRSKNIY